MVDTGSLTVNLITETAAGRLVERGAEIRKGSTGWKLQTLAGTLPPVDRELDFVSAFDNELEGGTKEVVEIKATAVVVSDELLPYSLLVGRPTIEKYKLLDGGKIPLAGIAYREPQEASGQEGGKDGTRPREASKEEINGAEVGEEEPVRQSPKHHEVGKEEPEGQLPKHREGISFEPFAIKRNGITRAS